jgi:hypothetical protein
LERPEAQKAFLHLKEQGEIVGELKDIRVIIPEVKQDILTEETETIKNYLFKCFEDDIIRNATRGIPAWYKNKLLENVKETV